MCACTGEHVGVCRSQLSVLVCNGGQGGDAGGVGGGDH